MAYYDENGKITIDEVAANKDIKRLREAAKILKESQASIRNLQRQSGDMQGLTALAIQEKGTEMEKKLGQMITKLESTADYIQKVVANYRRKDEELKRLIQAQRIAAEAVKSTIKPSPVNVQDIGKSGGASIKETAEAARQTMDRDALKETATKAAQKVFESFGDFFKK